MHTEHAVHTVAMLLGGPAVTGGSTVGQLLDSFAHDVDPIIANASKGAQADTLSPSGGVPLKSA